MWVRVSPEPTTYFSVFNSGALSAAQFTRLRNEMIGLLTRARMTGGARRLYIPCLDSMWWMFVLFFLVWATWVNKHSATQPLFVDPFTWSRDIKSSPLASYVGVLHTEKLDKVFPFSPYPSITKLGGNLWGQVPQMKVEYNLEMSKVKVTEVKLRKSHFGPFDPFKVHR